MAEGKEYARYDSNIDLEFRHARLTADPKIISDTFVKFTVVATSRAEGDEDMWLDVIPLDGQAPLAAFLKAKDVITFTGFPTKQLWGDNKDKTSITIKRARLHLAPEFIATLKERGYVPGTKTAGKGSKVKGGFAKRAQARQIVIPPDDDMPI